jgi:hypothetical protein
MLKLSQEQSSLVINIDVEPVLEKRNKYQVIDQ